MNNPPPHSITAEQGVIGSLLLDPAAWNKMAGRLAPEDFHRHDHRLIYRAIGMVCGQGVKADVITVAETLEKLGWLAESGGLSYLGSLAKETPSAANIDAYAAIVREKADLRKLAALTAEISALASEPGASSAADLRGRITAALSEISEPNKPNADLLADYIEAADMDGMEFSRTMLVEGLVEQGRVYEWFGKWKNGKTIAVIDLCAHASMGRTWGNRRTVPTLVVWVAGESCDDVKRRIAAWRIRHKITDPMPFSIRTKPVHLNIEAFAARLAQEVEALKALHPGLPVLLVVDTVARSLSPDCDENSIAGLGAFANNIIDHVVRPTGSAALCVHHSGHGDSDRGRGWSGFAAALDGSVKVQMDKPAIGPAAIIVSTTQARSTAGDDTLQFRVDTQEIPGTDNFGNRLSEPVLFYMGTPAQQPKAPTGRAQKTLLAILADMTKGKPEFRVGYKEFRGRCLAKDDGDKAMSASTFSDALKKLCADGHVVNEGPEVWIPEVGGSDGIPKFRIPKGISEFSEPEAAENPERKFRKHGFSEFSEFSASEPLTGDAGRL